MGNGIAMDESISFGFLKKEIDKMVRTLYCKKCLLISLSLRNKLNLKCLLIHEFS
jgi:hypothetical protein